MKIIGSYKVTGRNNPAIINKKEFETDLEIKHEIDLDITHDSGDKLKALNEVLSTTLFKIGTFDHNDFESLLFSGVITFTESDQVASELHIDSMQTFEIFVKRIASIKIMSLSSTTHDLSAIPRKETRKQDLAFTHDDSCIGDGGCKIVTGQYSVTGMSDPTIAHNSKFSANLKIFHKVHATAWFDKNGDFVPAFPVGLCMDRVQRANDKIKGFRSKVCQDSLSFHGEITVTRSDKKGVRIDKYFPIDSLDAFENFVRYMVPQGYIASKVTNTTSPEECKDTMDRSLLADKKVTFIYGRGLQRKEGIEQDHTGQDSLVMVCLQQLRNCFSC